MSLLRRLGKEPLIHFLILGLALFLLYEFAGGSGTAGNNKVIVNRNALLAYALDRPEYFEAAQSENFFDEVGSDRLQSVIEGYVREEVLSREARARGLDVGDPIIRKRLVQKLEFFSQGMSARPDELTEEDVALFFESHRDDYSVPAHVTFSHIFFDDLSGGRETALRRADAGRHSMNAPGIVPGRDRSMGDRFMYHMRYEEKTRDHIALQFGPSFADAVFDLEPGGDAWFGPLASRHGVHLVRVMDNSEARILDLDEVRSRVEDDVRRERRSQRSEAALRDIIDSYDVQVILDTNISGAANQATTSGAGHSRL